MKQSIFLIILGLAIGLGTSCRKDDGFNEDPGLKLSFSTDTITFDTVFTTVGSTTYWLKVYNTTNQRIKISSISIGGGSASRYRMNVNGQPSLSVQDIEIERNDSIFIFVRVSIDPNQTNTPLVVEDDLIFITNNQEQKVHLIAWGQDAYFYRRAIFQSSQTWSDDKPHVIYDYLLVDSSYSLTLLPGTRVYMHAHAVLAVNTDASLKVMGSMEKPVHFRGDRLEQMYSDIPGQWGRIWLSPGSINNVINYAILENGQVGLHVDTLGNSSNPTLVVSNTIIRNMSLAGMLFQGSWVEANNCIIGDCGEFAVILNIGGKYDFRHCTIGNHYYYGVRQTPSLVLNNYYIYEYDTIARGLESANFSNCIIWGRNEEELLLDRTPRAAYNYLFDHCLIRTESTVDNPSYYTSCIRNADPLFEEPYEGKLGLSAGSPAIDAGNVQTALGVPVDILGNNRTISPDLGAIEFVPQGLKNRISRP